VEWLRDIIVRVNQELKITIILIEHVMALVMAISQRVLVLDAGQLIREGSPKEVITDPVVIKAYLGEKFGAGQDVGDASDHRFRD
jgi:branched-chain amino acid transport system ATP-binding protein